MDRLDIQIFRSFGCSFGQESGDVSRLRPWVIARRIGANGRTVKLRIDKMHESGLIDHYQIYPNFRFFGLQGVAYMFGAEDGATKRELIDNCSVADGITEIHDFVGPAVCIEFACLDSRDELRRLELLRKLTRYDTPSKVYDRVMPPVSITPSRTDWRIIRALRYNALRELPEVASDLGLTAKPVHRRFERLTNNGAVLILPIVNPARVRNMIAFVLQVFPDPARWDDAIGKLLRAYDQKFLYSSLHPPAWGALYLVADTLAEMEDCLTRARSIEGVRNAETMVLKEVLDRSQWLDLAIERKIAESEVPLPAS